MKRSVWLGLLAGALGASPAMAQETSGPLEVNGGLVIWTLVVFGLLLFVLRKWAWPPLLAAVEARERALAEQLAEAERSRAEAARLLEEHRKLVADAKAQAHQLLHEARAVAEKERAVALEKSRQEQEELLAPALDHRLEEPGELPRHALERAAQEPRLLRLGDPR